MSSSVWLLVCGSVLLLAMMGMAAWLLLTVHRTLQASLKAQEDLAEQNTKILQEATDRIWHSASAATAELVQAITQEMGQQQKQGLEVLATAQNSILSTSSSMHDRLMRTVEEQAKLLRSADPIAFAQLTQATLPAEQGDDPYTVPGEEPAIRLTDEDKRRLDGLEAFLESRGVPRDAGFTADAG